MSTVTNAFDILEVFLKDGSELGVKDISRQSGVSISTTCRLTSQLVKKGYLQQPKTRGKYSLGLKFLDYYSAVRKGTRIVSIAMPYMIKLNSQIDENIGLVIWEAGEAVKVAVVESHQVLSVSSALGTRKDLHSTCEGKLLLAHISEKELNDYIKNTGLGYFTPNTITDKDRLKKELATIRQQGFAVDNEETRIGVRGISAPVRDDAGKVIVALGLTGPSIRMISEKDKEIIPVIRQSALDISRAAGFSGEP
jgi:IclR family transcriptional regulator, KDG regulon repressor